MPGKRSPTKPEAIPSAAEESAISSAPTATDQRSTSADEAVPQEDDSTTQKGKMPPVVIIGLAILGVTLAILACLAIFPSDHALARLRDVAIVFLVVLLFLSMLLLLYLLAVLIYAVNRLSDRLDDLGQRGGTILDEVKDTATTIKGTADFVGERVASPFIQIGAWMAGVGRGVRTFFRGEEQLEGHHE